MAAHLGTKTSFREAAGYLQEYLKVALSHEQVHRWVQEAGTVREEEEKAQVAAVYEAGQVAASEGRAAPVVVFEADGMYVHLQRDKSRGAELKLGVMHEGWVAESPAKKRFRLARAAIEAGNLRELKQTLAEAVLQAEDDKRVEQVKPLRQYLLANWGGLQDWRRKTSAPGAEVRGLGAAEGQIQHILAARMKKRGMSWGRAGAHRIALLRCLEAEERLGTWLERWSTQRWSARVDRTGRRNQVLERLERSDPTQWLAGRLPLLASAAGRSELGRLLKGLVNPSTAWELKSVGQPAPWGGTMVPPTRTA